MRPECKKKMDLSKELTFTMRKTNYSSSLPRSLQDSKLHKVLRESCSLYVLVARKQQGIVF